MLRFSSVGGINSDTYLPPRILNWIFISILSLSVWDTILKLVCKLHRMATQFHADISFSISSILPLFEWLGTCYHQGLLATVIESYKRRLNRGYVQRHTPSESQCQNTTSGEGCYTVVGCSHRGSNAHHIASCFCCSAA